MRFAPKPWSDARVALAIWTCIALFVVGLVIQALIKSDPSHDPPGTYLCHTFSTWNERNYAAFTVEIDGKTVACLEASQ